MKLIVESDHVLLRLNDYKLGKENLKGKVSQRGFTVKATPSSSKLLEKKLYWLQHENGLEQKSNEKVMRRYGLQKTFLERSVETSVKSVATRFVWMEQCIGSTIPIFFARAT